MNAPTAKGAISVVAIRAKGNKRVTPGVVTGVGPHQTTRLIPRCPPPRIQDRRWMLRTMAPAQRVEVEHMGYRHRLNIGAQLCLAFDQHVIVCDSIVLNIS